MASRGGDPKEQGHEAGVGHHGLAFEPREAENGRIQVSARVVERRLRDGNG